MYKKIIATALFAVAAIASTIASAQVTYSNSVSSSLYVQTGNAKVAAGGGSVKANTILLNVGSATDIPKDAEIIIRLPAGLNFDGNPSYLVTPSSPTLGLTLKDGSEFGDPTLDNPGITLADANSDGGMDRALVVVGAAGRAGDTLTISVNLTAAAGTTAGVKKVSVIVNAGLAVTQDIVEVVTGFSEPVFSASGTKLATTDQGVNTATVTAAAFTVTIPKGTAGGTKLTLTPQSKLTIPAEGTTATYTVNTPMVFDPFTVASGAAGGFFVTPTTPTMAFTVTGTTTYTLPDDVQVVITLSKVATESGGTIGTRGVVLSGAASGTAALVDVKANGSTAKVTALQTIPTIVAGATVVQSLPTIDVTENFDGDAITVGSTGTITITPGTGLKFSTSTPTLTGTGWGAATATISSTTGVMTIEMTHTAAGSKTVTISGLKATATTAAVGTLTITVGKPGSPDKTTAPNNILDVATAQALGSVTVAGPKTLNTTGPGGSGQVATLTFKEGTYGALTRANATQVNDAYFRITPSNATISTLTITFTGYPAGGTPTIGISDGTSEACAAENNVTTGAWICKIHAESTSVTPTTSTINVAVTYSAKSTAAIGSTVVMTVDGNSNVSGSATVANVGLTTKAAKGVVPDLLPGSLDAKNLAPVTITELFTGAVTTTVGSAFRLIAPTGVAFQDAAAISASSTTIGTVTITATFSPNDTLVINRIGTATITFTPKAVIASGLSGWLSFNIVDGDIDGKNVSNISAATLMLAYANGTLGAVAAGADGSVNINYGVDNTVSGGLAPYTVKSSNNAIGSPSISGNVVTVTGKTAGNVVITVTDELGGSDTYSVAVSAGATQPAAEKAAKTITGATTTATFAGGASSDGGTSYDTEFTTADDVTVVGTINVAAADQGSDGEIHVAVLSNGALLQLNAAGNLVPWNGTIAGLEAHLVAEPLGSVYNVTIYSGNLAAGTHRVALAYSTESGELVFTAKAMVITVTE